MCYLQILHLFYHLHLLPRSYQSLRLGIYHVFLIMKFHTKVYLYVGDDNLVYCFLQKKRDSFGDLYLQLHQDLSNCYAGMLNVDRLSILSMHS